MTSEPLEGQQRKNFRCCPSRTRDSPISSILQAEYNLNSLFVGCRAVWCDVGDHLTAGHGDTVTAHPVVLALPAVVVPDGTAIRERHAHLPAGGVRDRVPVPAVPVQGHPLGRARPLAVRLVMHLRGLPRGIRLVPHRHRLLRHARDRDLDGRRLAARRGLDRRGAGLGLATMY